LNSLKIIAQLHDRGINMDGGDARIKTVQLVQSLLQRTLAVDQLDDIGRR